MNDTAKKEPAPARPATTVLLLRPGKRGDPSSKLEVFMVVRHHAIDSFSGALVFPGGKLEDADGDKRLRARCTGAAALSDDVLKFRIAGIREAFEECGVLLAHKRGQKALIGAADLKPIESKWRKKLADDEASIVDLVDAEDLGHESPGSPANAAWQNGNSPPSHAATNPFTRRGMSNALSATFNRRSITQHC